MWRIKTSNKPTELVSAQIIKSSLTILATAWLSLIVLKILLKLSSIRVMSAASMAASLPMAPMAIPMSGLGDGGGVIDAVTDEGN